MAQIEYGDYYKFTASAGITLIAGSVVVPWMFLREPFDLATEATKIALLTPDAQNIIHIRQHLVAVAIHYVPYASGVMAAAGAALTLYGLCSWHSRQSIRDKGEELDVLKKDKELQTMTPQEIAAKAKDVPEVVDEVEPGTVSLQASASMPATPALAVEQALLGRISACLSPSMQVLSNQRLRNVEFDAIVKLSETRRAIVEIKYIRKGFNRGWVQETMVNLSLKVAVYGQTFEESVSGLLIVVIATSNSPLSRRVMTISDELKGSHQSQLENVRVQTLYEADISEMSCDSIRKLIVG